MDPCNLVWWVGSMDEAAWIRLPELSGRFYAHQSISERGKSLIKYY